MREPCADPSVCLHLAFVSASLHKLGLAKSMGVSCIVCKHCIGQAHREQSAHSRPNLTARAFAQKLRALKDQRLKGKVFGDVVAHVYVVEFQKRGLPHAHLLII